jgi:Ion channel
MRQASRGQRAPGLPDVAAPTGERAARLRPTLAKRGDRYGLLLFLLILSYLISAFTTSQYAGAFDSLLVVVVLLLALRTSGVHRQTMRLILAIAAIGTLTAVVLALAHATDIGVGIEDIWKGLVQLLTAAVIVRRVLEMPTVSVQSIYGAVSAYMIIGLMFASFYAAMSHLESGAFFANGSPGNTKTFQYFSFTTLTTLGYGDFTAAENGGRAVAVLEALAGQIFLATLVARLVASYRGARRNEGGQFAGPGGTGPAPDGTTPADTSPGGGPGATETRQAAQFPGPQIPGGDRRGASLPRRGNGARSRDAPQAPVKWRSRRQR